MAAASTGDVARLMFVARSPRRRHAIKVYAAIVDDPSRFSAFEKAQAALSSSLSRLIAVSEAYPELKATQAYRDLLSQLEGPRPLLRSAPAHQHRRCAAKRCARPSTRLQASTSHRRSGSDMAAFFVLALLAAFAPPPLTGRVVDAAGVFSGKDKGQLEQELTAFEQQTGHQLAVVVVGSLEGASVEEASLQTAELWRLGDKHRDDGMLLFVGTGDRRVRVEVGYGLEGVVTDAVASRVLRDVVIPRFVNGDLGPALALEVKRPANLRPRPTRTPSPQSTAMSTPPPSSRRSSAST